MKATQKYRMWCRLLQQDSNNISTYLLGSGNSQRRRVRKTSAKSLGTHVSRSKSSTRKMEAKQVTTGVHFTP